MIDDAMEFDEAHGDLSNNGNIEMGDAGDKDDYINDDYMNDEKGEEEGVTVCNVSVDGPCESVSSARSRMDRTSTARECPGRKRK